MKNMKKGMIGPLGDDIPSIFPIVAAVLLFTGTILYAMELAQEKNSYLEIRRGAIALSYAVTEKGFIEKDSFESACNTQLKPLGTAKSVSFLITIKRFCDGITLDKLADPNGYPKVSPYYVDSSTINEETWTSCSNKEGYPAASTTAPSQKVVLMNYPVAVPCPDHDSTTRGIGIINVIAWK